MGGSLMTYARHLLLLFITLGWLGASAWAQSLSSKFKEGEMVEVLHLGSWRPGTIVQTDRNRAQVEFEFAGSMRRQIFNKTDVRYEYEADALSPLRTWSDPSGQFKISAVVMDYDSEAKTVTLYRPDEDQTLTIEVSKLSEADQGRLEKLMSSAPPKAPKLPELTPFQVAPGFKASWSSATNLANIPPDPPKIAVGVPMGGVGFFRSTFHEKLVGLFPIGSSAGWMVGGTTGTGEDVPSRFVWVTLADGKVQKQHPIPDGQALVAVDPANQHVLTYGKDKEADRTTLTLWQASPKTEQAKPLLRWASQETDRFASPSSWADFVSPTRVIHQWNRHSYVVWDFEAKRSVYSITQESFFGARPVLSPGKHYFAVPEDERVRLLDADDGRTLAVLPIEGGSSSGVAFSADGEKLAVMTRNQIAIWQLGSAGDPERVRGDAVGSPFSKSLAWIDDRSLLVGGEVMFDLDRELPVWKYQPTFGEVNTDSFGSRTISIAGGKYCYSVDVRRGAGNNGGIVVGAVELPGPQVREVVDSVDPSKLYAISRGDAVSLDVNCGEFGPRVQAALQSKIAQNGWVLQSGAPFVLEAKMGRGERQSVTYENRMNGQRQTASVVPFTANLTLRRAGADANSRALWSSGTSTGLAPMMFLREGETAQQKANEQQRPRPEFFDDAKIPEQIFDNRFSAGFGVSSIDSRGLTPKPIDNLPIR